MVDLYWVPLGAGTPVVQWCGRLFELVMAWWQHRPRNRLFHAALVVEIDGVRVTVEQAPVPDDHGELRGVVATGPVGLRWLGRWRVFRYEVRRWPGGSIPDLDAAVGPPRRITDDPAVARRVLEAVAAVPTPVWGRDEQHAGEMWNSNSVVAWTLDRAGVDVDAIACVAGGRAPGWHAGLVGARRPPMRF
ncbi:MAG: hypothetical protein FJW95_10980 [Actinobacteria bacterium]|nr:hypothetical protein [Actinomycetota bacterium]